MGNSRSGPSQGSLPSDRNLHVTYLSYQRVHGTIKDVVVYKFQVGTGRYVWPLYKRYSEVHALDAVLIEKYSSPMSNITLPPRVIQLLWANDPHAITERGRQLAVYLEQVGAVEVLFTSPELMEFLEISKVILLDNSLNIVMSPIDTM